MSPVISRHMINEVYIPHIEGAFEIALSSLAEEGSPIFKVRAVFVKEAVWTMRRSVALGRKKSSMLPGHGAGPVGFVLTAFLIRIFVRQSRWRCDCSAGFAPCPAR
jgi:hypothetical protein